MRTDRFGRARVIFPALAALLLVGPAQGQDPQVLLRQYRCYMCHADRDSKTGPAYVDVARRYRGNARAVAILTAEITKGVKGSGPWHMPPHPEVSDADARKMARYILSLKK